tara:strand:- start:362 stop:505 length:144 start_codon:yes stop_codon:yes gene_type:complete
MNLSGGKMKYVRKTPKKTSQGGARGSIKYSSMNKSKKRSFKPSRGQG